MNQLKALGFRIALDDFGVCHSALALLGTLPVDIVKVDASFITNQTIETTKGIIAKHIVALSKNLQLKTCCEGIETENEAKLAKTINSDYMQGYLFSYPLTVTKFKQFIKDYIISDE
jgi:EAL domain-containing protein (putative c-di-GMP-specific phosphodiesterase class I)